MQLKRIAICAFPLIFSAIIGSNIPTALAQKKEQQSQKKDVSTLAWELLELINRERKELGILSLSFSPELSDLAKMHSQDMASRGKISHFSSSGESYRERLVEAGFYFIAIGENVAFSNIFQAEPIHQFLMDSPGHRENILDPNFDQVGIGVVFREDKGYYVTQDFRRAPVLKEEEVVKEDIQKEINLLRRDNFLPPLLFFQEADEYARKCSLNKSKDRSPPPLPSNFGETQFFFITSPSLEGIQPIYKDNILDKIYERAGLGVIFGQSKKYPGGTYFITLLLFAENKYKSWSNKDLKDTIFRAINEVRGVKGVDPLKWDNNLTTHAEETVKKIFIQRNNSSITLPKFQRTVVLYFVTENPTVLPEKVKGIIKNNLIGYARMGMGIIFGKSHEFPRGAFWVSILLEE